MSRSYHMVVASLSQCDWQKVTITKQDLLDILETLSPEELINPLDPLANIEAIVISAQLVRETEEYPSYYGITAYVDDIVINTTTSTCGNRIDHIYIYDETKSWTPGMLTGGNFYLKSGKVRGYSSDILDNGTNYIEVPTTWINIVNNITSGPLGVYCFENQIFQSGDLTGWDVYNETSPYDTGTVVIGSSPPPPQATYFASIYHNTDFEGWAYTTSITNNYPLFNAYPTNVSFWLQVLELTYDAKVIAHVYTESSTIIPATLLVINPGEVDNLWHYYTLDIPDPSEIITSVKFMAYIYDSEYGGGVSNFKVAGLDFGDSITGTPYSYLPGIGDEYLISYTPTTWSTVTPTVVIGNVECGANVTTLTSTWYGDGDFVLEFSTQSNRDSGYTWRIDEDVFYADTNVDYSRIASMIKGRGSKLCGGEMVSIVGDSTYELIVSTIGDTFLRTAASAGSDHFYVYDNTHFGTAHGYGDHYILCIGVATNMERVEVSATGADGFCQIWPCGTLAYGHGPLEPVLNEGCFYATGTKEQVDNFIEAFDSMGSWRDVYVGYEQITLDYDIPKYTRIDDNTIQLFIEGFRYYHSVARYPHAPGAPVFPVYYPGYPTHNPDSLVARYGHRTGNVNPVGIVDSDAMDKLCYYTLKSGTARGTWGRVKMPFLNFPTDVDIGDWVNITEHDYSATVAYQVVGIEYDMESGFITIELGSTEDYYLESVSNQRGTFDLSLSNT